MSRAVRNRVYVLMVTSVIAWPAGAGGILEKARAKSPELPVSVQHYRGTVDELMAAFTQRRLDTRPA